MTSKKKEETIKTPIKHESFNFGEYVSPVANPKPIPLGKYRPSPLIQYDTSIITKTDSKHKQITKPENQNPQQENIQNKEISPPKKHNKLESKSFKHKATKQKKELKFLQSQLVRLQIENEKMKNESSGQQILKKRGRIVFDPSVQIMHHNLENKGSKSIYLTDKISSIRSKRDLTPYKPKNPYNNPSSRSEYRITPIPQKRNKRGIFKANLQSIEDKETDKENIENNNNNKNSKASFDLGKEPLSFSNSPKDLRPNTSDSSHSTPEYMYSSNSASTVVTPILTPIKKGNNCNSIAKPFLFSWNKKK